MDRFIRPFLPVPAGGQEPYFPYSDSLLASQPIFPLLVMDGGCYCLCRELFPPHASGDDILKAFQDGSFFSHWSRDGAFRWDVWYDDDQKSLLPLRAEQHVWINRLYFLLPLAQQYLKRREKAYADEWYRWLDLWRKAHPYQCAVDRPINKTDYIWRDMQVAWRLLVLVYSLKMLGDGGLNERDFGLIYAMIVQHADHLLLEAEAHLKNGFAHNHVLQIGVALLYAGILFPEFGRAADYRRTGRDIVALNLKKAVLQDGGSVEGSCSYSHFIARLYLEAHLLLTGNGLASVDGLEESLQRQYRWLYQMSSGSALQVGDSYPLDADNDLSIAESLFSLRFEKRKASVLFPDSKCAVLRNEKFEVFIDGMDKTQGHQHFGRPHILVNVEGAPFLVDSGCCNYDRVDLRKYLLSDDAHNTIVFYRDERERDGFQNEIAICEVIRCGLDGPVKTIAYRVAPLANPSRCWTRTVVLSEDALRIQDSVDSDTAVRAVQKWHLAPLTTEVQEDGHAAVSGLPGKELRLESRSPLTLSHCPCMDKDNAVGYTPTLSAVQTGKSLRFEISIY